MESACMGTKNYTDFIEALGAKESAGSGGYQAVNRFG